MPSLEIRDANGKRLHEGDLVLGKWGWLSGDGYLPKKFPREIRRVFRIEWDKFGACYALNELGTFHEDADLEHELYDNGGRWYRSVKYGLRVSPPQNGYYGTYRRDMICDSLVKVPKTTQHRRPPYWSKLRTKPRLDLR